jgi:hypothetical protein
MALQQYRYTLDNPSGHASNPLEDFLERSKAGHCEYFASALAFMLRHRGIPARVVNGYRLGPWIEEGGYWLVTQNEAHSWVEFYDDRSRTWITADPTPSAPPNELYKKTLMGALSRWADSLRFRWDRYVVRFSDADQVAGLEWIREHGMDFAGSRLNGPLAWIIGTLAALTLVFRHIRGWRPFGLRWLIPKTQAPQGILALKPLLRKTRKMLPHHPGETARAWISRLMMLKPERAEALTQLADETDRVGYGGTPDHRLKALVKAEVKAWRS